MPTNCDPCPGNSIPTAAMNCLSSLRTGGVAEENGAPGEAAAKACQHHEIAGLQLAAARELVVRDGNRGRRRVAVAIEVHHHALFRNLEALAHRVDNADIGLVG